MPTFPAVPNLGFVFKYDNFLPSGLLYHLRHDTGSFHNRMPQSNLLTIHHQKDPIQIDVLALSHIQLVHLECLARGHSVLLAPCFNDRVENYMPPRKNTG